MRTADRTSWVRRLACLLVTATLVSGTVSAPTALEAGVRKRIKRIGRKIGHGVVHAGEEIGDFAEHAGKEVGHFS